MSLFDPPQSVAFLPKRSIGPFTGQVIVEEIGNDRIEITRHPVQRGSTITDHAFTLPATLGITAVWSDNERPLAEMYEKLLALQASAEPFEVVTGKRAYSNMLLASLSCATDRETENVLSIRMELEQIRIVDLEIVKVPARSRQESPGTTGATETAGKKSAAAVSEESAQGRSALAALAGL